MKQTNKTEVKPFRAYARELVLALRSVAFIASLVIFVCSVVLVCWPFIYVSRRVAFFVFSSTTRVSLWLMRLILRIKVRFENLDILHSTKAAYPCFLLAPKHQSEIETLIFSIFFDSFRIVYKQGINELPIISSYMKRMNFIAIDREAGRAALQTLLDEGLKSIGTGSPILIFPEGTRTAFGERGNYHAGVALMYEKMNVPILPVVHNSGQFFKPHAFIKDPGEIVFRFLPPIYPGLSAREALKELEAKLEEDKSVHNIGLSA
ncbi:MAG: 1-acyl-sn-glycerol-3-phosphate acyltransferase [Holosporales bacterium]|jgi:1-acyl-sn-glycerol-3-phosphate acyltransferase|nr:1-acyl-sn-glycerol-3-phosphate acyltransferase [Holosporales bacterium]